MPLLIDEDDRVILRDMLSDISSTKFGLRRADAGAERMPEDELSQAKMPWETATLLIRAKTCMPGSGLKFLGARGVTLASNGQPISSLMSTRGPFPLLTDKHTVKSS